MQTGERLSEQFLSAQFRAELFLEAKIPLSKATSSNQHNYNYKYHYAEIVGGTFEYKELFEVPKSGTILRPSRFRANYVICILKETRRR